MSRVRTPLLALLAMALVAALVQPAAADPSVFLPGLVSSNPVNGITPHIIDGGRQDGVKGMAQIGNTMVVAGSFTQVEQVNGGPTFTRNHIFSFDVTTGAISTTFVPQLDGKVESVQPAPDGLSVFIGGYFGTVNGATHKRVARVYLSNGQNVPGFNANVTSGKRVMDMSIDGNTLYLGGQFSKIGTHERRRLRGAQRRHRRGRPAGELRVRRQPERRPDAGPAHGHLARRLDRRGDRQLRHRERPGLPSDREAQRGQPSRDDRGLADQPIQERLRVEVRQLHARRGHRSGRHVLRRRHHGRLHGRTRAPASSATP